MTILSRSIRTAACAGLLLCSARAHAAVSPADSMPVPPPQPLSYTYDACDQSVIRPLTRLFDPALLVRRVTGARRESADLDAQDRVQLPTT